MSPRPRASRHDDTAVKCLQAAARLIDASLDSTETGDPRLRSMRFPASLDWIRIDDVVRVANRSPETSISKKALTNRWETRGDFLLDAVLFALIFSDDAHVEPPEPLRRAGEAHSFSASIARSSDQIYETLLAHPRSFLLCQIAPYFPQHPELADVVGRAAVTERDRWTGVYEQVRHRLGFATRPDWPMERVGLALQCILDGFVLRFRVEPTVVEQGRWRRASLFADTVLSFVLGTLDHDGAGRTVREQIDLLVPAQGAG